MPPTGRTDKNTKTLKQFDGSNAATPRFAALAIGILISVLGVQLSLADDEAAPWQTIPSDLEVPTNAVVYPSPGPLPFPGGGEPPSSIDPAVSFIGLNDDNTRIPPDTMGAVGPNHVVTMLNTQVRITDRAGTNIYSTVSLSNFWGSVGGLNFAFDPRIVYDPYNQRWIAAACADPPPNYANTSSLLIGVSQGNNPTGAWYRFKIDVDANNGVWADYPSLGFNQNWVVVQVNMFMFCLPGFCVPEPFPLRLSTEKVKLPMLSQWLERCPDSGFVLRVPITRCRFDGVQPQPPESPDSDLWPLGAFARPEQNYRTIPSGCAASCAKCFAPPETQIRHLS